MIRCAIFAVCMFLSIPAGAADGCDASTAGADPLGDLVAVLPRSAPAPQLEEARAAILAVLPRISAATNAFGESAGLDVNASICHAAAGLTAAKLRELGYTVRLVETPTHITVRVKTAQGELIVDPTMAQFFEDGSTADRWLLEQGGFVGTENELGDFLVEHFGERNGSFGNIYRLDFAPGEVSEEELRTYIREVVGPDYRETTLDSHFRQSSSLGSGGKLRYHAKLIADGFQRYRRTGVADGPNTRKAYQILAE